ncbi:MAG: hypothetical protein GX100_03900, partial [candidate division WS1 bacterium]|nr:hypothetical protein [candidate division WS1 bacterium]
GDLMQGEAPTPEARARLLAGTRVMERYQPPEYRAELKVLASALGVDYMELMAAQLFGDVWRAPQCSSYAVWGEATADGKCYAGRNMDFWDHGIASYGMVLLHYTPDRGLPFVTVSWSGIINGWTAMNTAGIVCSNNTSGGGQESLQGISTCFMVRKVAQYARTVAEGVEIVRRGPRAAGTNLLIAGPEGAAMVEFDHDRVAVRYSEVGADAWTVMRDYVVAGNVFRWLLLDPGERRQGGNWGRYGTLRGLIRSRYGQLGPEDNLARVEGIPLSGMNLQCVFLCPTDRTFQIAMGPPPASKDRFREYRLTARGLDVIWQPQAPKISWQERLTGRNQ